MRFKEGDCVRIVEREATPADAKNEAFYPYFCGLVGTVDRVYGKEICVKVDLEALPKDALKRHLNIQESIKRKWLDNVSGEVRHRLTPEEKRFELAYTILVQSGDLEKLQSGKARQAAIERARHLNQLKAAKAKADEKAKAKPDELTAPQPSIETQEAEPVSYTHLTLPTTPYV